MPNVAPVASSASAKLQKRVDACPGPVSGVIGPRARVLTDLPLGMPIAHSLGALCSLGAAVKITTTQQPCTAGSELALGASTALP